MEAEAFVTPVRYADTLHYIGTRNSPSWLLESTDGLILIDTAMPNDLDLLLKNIALLGHSVKDVRHIIHSHGHIDHIGCTAAIVERSGALTYIGRGDEGSVSGENSLQWTNEFRMTYEGAFRPDVILSDGDTVTIGNREFHFVATPGHTAGTLSIFFNVTDGGREWRAGMFGGGGLNSMAIAYLDRYGLPHSLREDFLASIDKVMDERVEMHLGNHLGDNRHLDKLAALGGGENPFLDGSSWRPFLERRRAEAIEFFKTN